jgi:hypothetical protein
MRLPLCFLFIGLLAGCRAPEPETPAGRGPGIYYWKTSWQMTPAGQAALRHAGVHQLFLRFFDVDWDFNLAEARPRGMLQLPDSLILDSALSVTPVVFIVERVFRQDVDVAELADRVGRTVTGLSAKHPALARATRWQIDCDWMPTSRDRYFAFLEALQSRHPGLKVSVTVRLHQYRERTENGVPPAAEGLLMCYNMEPVQSAGTANAIYREDLLRGYLKAPPYPIPLDAGLPIFEWGAAFRGERFLGITPPPDSTNTVFLPVSATHFLLRRDTTLGETFLRAGDLVRYDGPENTRTLVAAARLLRARPEVRDLVYFDWDEKQLGKFKITESFDTFYGD